MKIWKKTALIILVSGFTVLTGCSSSEEAAKEQTDEAQTGEFKKVDREEDITPATDRPSDELPSREKPSPVVKESQQQPVEQPQQARTGLMMWSVQVGAFKNEQGALQLVNEARAKFNQPLYKDYDPVSGFYKVTIGSFQTREQASNFKAEVQTKGYPDAFTVEVRR